MILASFVAIEPLVTIQGIVDNVLVTDIVEDAKRNDAFSLLRIAANLGFSIGPAMGGYLAYLNYGFVFIAPDGDSQVIACSPEKPVSWNLHCNNEYPV